MRSTLLANSGNREGRTYFLSPHMSRLRHSRGSLRANRSSMRLRSCADSLTVSTSWNGRATRTGLVLAPSEPYFPSHTSSGNSTPPHYSLRCAQDGKVVSIEQGVSGNGRLHRVFPPLNRGLRTGHYSQAR